MSFLRLENVHKSFDSISALDGISLEVDHGETVAIIGPSGCGKTTLLRCIALLETLDRGSIVLDGQPIITAVGSGRPRRHVDVNQYRSRVGMVFQQLNIWPNRTVLENLTLAPMIVREDERKQTTDRALSLLREMGISDKADDYPRTLSGGQQQRVALGRALMMEPDVLLLDEITSALDPELVGEILDIIAGLSRRGMTMLIVTHEMLFASEVADRVVFIDKGQLMEQGAPGELFSKPRTERLDAFLARIRRHRTMEVRP
jgi:ABC-type polar amino acid transport system ATPase subunit